MTTHTVNTADNESFKDTTPRQSGMLELLRSHPTFARLMLGSLISALGDSLTWMSLTWLLLEKTHDSGALVGIMLMCFSLPAVLTGSILGRLVDRFGAKSVMMIDNLARALIVALIPLLSILGRLELWMIFPLAALCGALAPASQVGIRVMLPHLVNKRQLEVANAVLSFTFQIPNVLAPPLAGVLVGSLGAANTLLLDAGSFVVFAALLATLHNNQSKLEGRSCTNEGGFKLLKTFPAVIAITTLTVIFNAAYGPLEAALPVQAKAVLGADARGYGLLWSVFGVGTILGGLLVLRLARFNLGLVLALITLAWGVAQFGLALTPELPLALLGMFVGGVIWGPYTSLETALIQRLVPSHLQGRVFGARQSLISPSTPLGAAIGGAMLGVFPSSLVIAISALACVLAGMVALFLPVLRGSPSEARREPIQATSSC